jgi:NAD+ kinase
MGMLTSVGVVLHPSRAPGEAITTLMAWAQRQELPVFGLAAEVGRLDCAAVAVGDDELAARSSLLVSLGGDGTMLRTMRLAHRARTPVLGVNNGRLGFLAEVDLPDLPGALSAIDAHAFTVEARSSVTCVLAGSPALAYNDIAFVRVPGAGMAVVDVVIDGDHFVRYSADAVVVATPTGSTAYSFSAGGPLVSPRIEGLLVVPAAPHSTFNRALMLHHDEKLVLEVLPSSGRLAVEVDGNVLGHVEPGDKVAFDVDATAGRVVRLGRTTFYERARRKLHVSGSVEALP